MPNRKVIKQFSLLLVLSGFCGISYEVLYARLIGNLLGDQFAVSVSVLMTFLLGIGCGTLFAHRFWPYLWAIEGGIGLWATAMALSSPLLDRLSAKAATLTGNGLIGTLFLCAVPLSVPAFLIGSSLPLFAGYLGRLTRGGAFSRAYTAYNFGAAATVLLIEFWLLRAMGLRRSILIIGSLNLITAATLFYSFRRLSERPNRLNRENASTPHHGPVIELWLASLASAIFQLVMIKVAECFLGPFRETFALVLALVLLGQAVGTWLTQKLRLTFSQLMVTNVFGLAWLMASFGLVSFVYAGNYAAAATSATELVFLKLKCLVLLMGLPSLTFGATVPALFHSRVDLARHSGRLLFISCAANAAGFLLMATVLHRYLDYGVLFMVVAGFSLFSVVFSSPRPGQKARTWAVAGFALVCLSQRFAWDENLLYLGHTAFHTLTDLTSTSHRLKKNETFKGSRDVFSILWQDDTPYFFINGFISVPLKSPPEKLVGAFAALFAPNLGNALVLGVGSGATAGTVGLLFEHTDAIEINPVVIENLDRMTRFNFDIIHRPSVSIILDDGIHFIKTTPQKYSLILNTVTTPLYFSSSKLYTTDFFENVAEKLVPGGVYATWIDGRVGPVGFRIMLKSLSQTFDECAMGFLKSTYYLLVCSKEPPTVRNPRVAADNPNLREYLRVSGGLNPDWIPYGLITPHVFKSLGVREDSVPINTLDYPALEFEIARLEHSGLGPMKPRVRSAMHLQTVEEALKPVLPWNPLHLLLYAEKLVGPSLFTERWREQVAANIKNFDDAYPAALRRELFTQAEVVQTPGVRAEIAQTLMNLGDFSQAAIQLEKALVAYPGFMEAHLNLGICLEEMREYSSAIKEYALVKGRRRQEADARFRRGSLLLRLRRYREAVDDLQLSLAREKEDKGAETHFTLGLALEGLKQFAQARAEYEKALELKPESTEFAGALSRSRSHGERRPAAEKRRKGISHQP